MKNQINTLNIAGAVVSASLMVFSYFLPSTNALSHAKRSEIFKTPKIQIRQKLSLARNKQLVHSTLTDVPIFPNTNQEKEIPRQTSSLEQISPLEIQKQEEQTTKLAEKCEKPSKSSGCPKNLDYFTKRPRPKQTPEECFSCRNLITCVCLIDK